MFASMFVIAPSVNILRISTVEYMVAFVNLILKKMMMMHYEPVITSWKHRNIALSLSNTDWLGISFRIQFFTLQTTWCP